MSGFLTIVFMILGMIAASFIPKSWREKVALSGCCIIVIAILIGLGYWIYTWF